MHCQIAKLVLQIGNTLFAASTSVCLSHPRFGICWDLCSSKSGALSALTRSWKRNVKIWSESFKNRSVTSSLGDPIHFELSTAKGQ